MPRQGVILAVLDLSDINRRLLFKLFAYLQRYFDNIVSAPLNLKRLSLISNSMEYQPQKMSK